MDTIQIAETLKTLLSQGCKNEQILDAVVLRVVNSLHDNSAATAALIAELQKYSDRESQKKRQHQLGEELWSDTKAADLRFIRRHPKVSFIYEITAYWWKSSGFA